MQQCESFLVLFSVFVRKKVAINENRTFTDYASGIRLPDSSKFSNIIIKFFWHCFFSLTVLSYWSKFHVNIITGSGVVAIFFYKGVTRNPEIGNNPIWVLPNIWRLGQVGIPNLARMPLIKCYWMLQNDRVTAFTVSELLREIQQGGVKLPPPPPRLGLMRLYH